MAKIFSPVKNYNGMSAGISFRDGEGKTDSLYLIEWFKKHGYKVVDEEKETKSEEKSRSDAANFSELQDMSLDELKAYAEAHEINIGNATTKEGILKKIKEAE